MRIGLAIKWQCSLYLVMTMSKLKQGVISLKEMPANRGVSKHLVRDIIGFIRHHPDEVEFVLDALTPHIGGMGTQPLGQIAEAILLVSPERLPEFIERIPPGPAMIRQLDKMTLASDQPRAFLLARKRAVNIASPDELIEFDTIAARRALICSLYEADNRLLDAILDTPGGRDIEVKIQGETADWYRAVILQTYHQTASLDHLEGIFHHLASKKVPLGNNEGGCAALRLVCENMGKTNHGEAIMNWLMDLGAEWQGMGLEEIPQVWPRLKKHPKVKSDLLMNISREVQENRPARIKPSM